MADLPGGTVTLVFTDIEGSTGLLHELGDAYADTLAEHRRIVRTAFRRHGGVEVETQGDAFFYAFARAPDALSAAQEAQDALAADGQVRVRMGVHTGEPIVTAEGYVGMDVHRAARVMSAGHGGQVVVSAQTAALAGEAALKDLGLHRLKDLGSPEKLFQLGEGTFPPLRTLGATNLPVAPTPLLGRRDEVQDVVGLLRDGARVVTITGLGGAGKTRLALQSAAELVDSRPDGVFWVPLAGLHDGALVLPAIASELGARGDLREHLRGKRMLLVLDNFEHVLDAAGAVGDLLGAAAHLQLLVTSRAPLRLSGEREYPLEPLEVQDAVALFVERARAVGRPVEPDATVEAIVRRVDGLPLAVELAAGRTRLFPPAALLDRLDRALPVLTGGPVDAPDRQRTLRATIDWSYELLPDTARRLFERLAVFRGGFSLTAAERICGAELDALETLVEFNLVKPLPDGRFLMLETIREHAAEVLEARGERAEVDALHADAFAELAQAEAIGARTGERGALERLGVEHENLLAALEHATETGNLEVGERLVVGLWLFWLLRGFGGEGRRRVERLLERGVGSPSGLLLVLAGELARFTGDLDRALELKEAAIDAFETSMHASPGPHESLSPQGGEPAVAAALTDLAEVLLLRGELDRAEQAAMRALSIRMTLGDPGGIAHARDPLVSLELRRGNSGRARELAEESIADWRAVEAPIDLAFALCIGAAANRALGEAARARALVREALELARAAGNDHVAATAVEEAAALLEHAGRSDTALLLRGSAGAWREQSGQTFGVDALAAVAAAAPGASASERDRRPAEGAARPLSWALETAVAALEPAEQG